ncbi:MAG: MATE family multidrug resistance protein [Myxococcota bacterium]|jgi:MATE family multidrug resistance protein
MSTTHTHTLRERIERRHVATLAWPIVVSMLSFTLMSIIDTVYVAQLGTTHVAAIGLAAVTFFTFHAFGKGALSGVRITVAERIGEGRPKLARALAWQGLYLALALGVAEASLALIAEPLFGLLGGSEAVHGMAVEYFVVCVLGGPVAFGMYALTCYSQGRGNTQLPMVATLIANGVNIALDPLLIFGLGPFEGMGLSGAALATVIACAVGFAFLWLRLRKDLKITEPAERKLSRARLAWIWRVGSPLGISATLRVSSFVVLSSILASISDAELAAHIIVVRVISVSFLPGYGIGEAVSVLVGQAIGAGRFELIAQTERAGVWLALIAMGLCGVIFLAIPDILMLPFDPSAEVAEIGVTLLYIAAAFQITDAYLMAGSGVLNGASDTRFVMLMSMVTAWAVKLPLAYVLADTLGFGAVGAWIGLTGEIVIETMLVRWRIRKAPWLAARAVEVADEEASVALAA